MGTFWDFFKGGSGVKTPPLPGSKTATVAVGDKDWGDATTYNKSDLWGGLGSGLSWNAKDDSLAGLTDKGSETASALGDAAGAFAGGLEGGGGAPTEDPGAAAAQAAQAQHGAFEKEQSDFMERWLAQLKARKV